MEGQLDMNKIPKHIAIIMDGNGRWAKKRGLPRVMGHRAGMEAIRHAVRGCSDLGVKILTIYAFSTENWKRPKDEVSYLLNLLVEYMRKEIRELNENNVKIKVLGDITALPELTATEIKNAIKMTESNTGLQLNIAINYGGRSEILNACKKIMEEVQKGNISIDAVDEKMISEALYTQGDADPDLIIRTSGEQRTSNFLLWQGAYSELIFVEEYWPDFRKENLIEALHQYQMRDRRFGALK